MPSSFPPFRAGFPWWGGDLQTLRNYLTPGRADLSPWPGERLSIAVADGSGDRLLAALHLPATDRSRPLAVLVHGLTGCEGSFYVLETARFLLTAGYPVLRLNLRGAGPSRETCSGQYSAGSSVDLGAVIGALGSELTARGHVLVGYSLGGNIVLKYLAEAPATQVPLCAVAISTPIDLGAAAHRMMAPRNALYHRWLLARMKREAVAGAARTDPEERRAIQSAETVYEYDDRFVAPRNGFAGADDYYRRCSAAGFVGAIKVPTLVVQARNDPWIPAAAYDSIEWGRYPAFTVLLPPGGGHVGFHDGQGDTPWHNRCLATFMDRTVGSGAITMAGQETR